jgi:hypothetical protein
MTEHNIEIPCNTEVVIRVSCKEVAVEPILVTDPLPLDPTPEPIVEAIPEPEIDPVPTPEPVVEIIPVIAPDTIPVEPEPIPLPPVIIDSPVTLPVSDPLPPVVEPLPAAPTEHCYCDLDSPLSLPDFVKQLTNLTKGLLYPSESDFSIEVLSKGFSSKMPNVKGIEVRNLDRVIPTFLRAENTRWQALYDFIEQHASVTAWHYPVKQKKYTHELIVILLHPQGTVALRIKLVET